jgi:hypothetical protein
MASSKPPAPDPRLVAAMGHASKRAKIAIEHMVKHGSISTDDLSAYGYEHAPRVIADVREIGLPIVMKMTTSPKTGRRMATYRLADLSEMTELAGRRVLPKVLREALIETWGERCAICGRNPGAQLLQVDHCIPFRVSGVEDVTDEGAFMLLCASCQRRKSWSCEKCPNWAKRETATCVGCFWASPDDYTHAATVQERRVELVFAGDEIGLHDVLAEAARADGISIVDYVKRLLQASA